MQLFFLHEGWPQTVKKLQTWIQATDYQAVLPTIAWNLNRKVNSRTNLEGLRRRIGKRMIRCIPVEIPFPGTWIRTGEMRGEERPSADVSSNQSVELKRPEWSERDEDDRDGRKGAPALPSIGDGVSRVPSGSKWLEHTIRGISGAMRKVLTRKVLQLENPKIPL